MPSEMDQFDSPSDADARPILGQSLRLHCDADLPPGFIPLRLVLQGSAGVIEVTKPDAIVGRHTEADVRLPLPDVSRRHCRLLFREGGWRITDLNSLNGVQLNDESILEAPLEQDDRLRIGGFHFVVDLAADGGLAGSGHVQSILEALAAPRRQAS
jgi:pSer/pThr/pTyr-binding forkhead associated (FHA) protein